MEYLHSSVNKLTIIVGIVSNVAPYLIINQVGGNYFVYVNIDMFTLLTLFYLRKMMQDIIPGNVLRIIKHINIYLFSYLVFVTIMFLTDIIVHFVKTPELKQVSYNNLLCLVYGYRLATMSLYIIYHTQQVRPPEPEAPRDIESQNSTSSTSNTGSTSITD